MSLRLVRRPSVLDDLRDAAAYIAQDNLSAALRLLDEFETTAEMLAAQPHVGPRLEWLGSHRELRRWPIRGFGNYLVIYEVTKTTVDLIRIVHGARDLPTLVRGI